MFGYKRKKPLDVFDGQRGCFLPQVVARVNKKAMSG
jgi:hypothetical protein